MTIHSSLRGVNSLEGERSVLTRVERIQKLSKEGKFDAEESSVWGLPKVRTKFKVAGVKKKKAAEGEGAEGEAKAEGTEGESAAGESAEKSA